MNTFLFVTSYCMWLEEIYPRFYYKPKHNKNSFYLIDPLTYNVKPDSPIPLLMAYNLYHYESLHPCTNTDIITSIRMVKSNLEYPFSIF